MGSATATTLSTIRHHPYAYPYSNQPTRGGVTWRPSLGGRGRGRGGRVLPPAHRNRSLVLNTTGTPSLEQTSTASPTPSGDATGNMANSPGGSWVSKHDRHKQLINTSIYETETMKRTKGIEETRKLKASRRNDREKTRIMRSLQNIAVTGSFPGARYTIPDIPINGSRFRPSSDGSKLSRLAGRALDATFRRPDLLLSDDVTSTRPTPQKVNALGGVYIRSKNGNLYRSGLVKSKQYVLYSMADFYYMLLCY